MVRRKQTRATSTDVGDGNPGVLHVVGVGASAGGLEALSEMLSALVPGASHAGVGITYVIAQHLAPGHSSELVALLQRTTTLRVVEAVDGALLRPDEVFIGPPNGDMLVDGHRLRVFEPAERVSPSPSIDVLLESIAAQHGLNGVGVVLSGTGSDGALGIRSIRAAGGITIVQAPETARFDAMPRAAIALGLPDLVLSPKEIGQRLGSILLGDLGRLGESGPPPAPDGLAAVANQVRRISGVDFSQYKHSTLGRQVQRRMALRQVAVIEDYVQLLAADAGEADALTKQL